MHDLIDLDLYPLDQPQSAAWLALVDHCKAKLDNDGMFNLPGLILDDAIETAVA